MLVSQTAHQRSALAVLILANVLVYLLWRRIKRPMHDMLEAKDCAVRAAVESRTQSDKGPVR